MKLVIKAKNICVMMAEACRLRISVIIVGGYKHVKLVIKAENISAMKGEGCGLSV